MRERKGQRGRSYTNTELNSGSVERAKNKERDRVLTCLFSSRFDVTALEDIPIFGITNTTNM